MATSTGLKGRYELQQILARGGMGVVYKALDNVMKRHVAVKTLLDITDPSGLQLFQKECDVLASMTHPNIIEIYDAGQFEDEGVTRPFLVMPLLPGVTLDKLIRSESQCLTVARSIEIICQACRGLHAAHEMGLVHRDVKPTNIFVMEDDSVKIIDFGVAHRLETSRTVGRKGTLLYMSPEQIEMKPVSAASDIFSLAVVCYETLTRRRPFERATENSVAHAILHHVPAPMSEINPAVNPAVSQAVHKAMAKQPWHRYASAREFAETLQKALRNEPIEAFDPGRIRPRLQRASDTFDRGDFQFASEILGELEAEGHMDPSISALRGRIEEAIRRKSTSHLMETARLRIEEEEYSLALQKIHEVLQLDPDHAEAVALKSAIEAKRADRDVEQWLGQARQYADALSFGPAREALRRILQLRPNDVRALELLSGVDGKEQEYERARQEKEELYHSAMAAGQRGEITSALNRLEKVLELERRLPDPAASERAAAYHDLYDRLRSEHEGLQRAYAEAKDLLEAGDFSAALTLCSAQLARYPDNALFQSLKLDIEERRRQLVAARMAEAGRAIEDETDVDRRIAMLGELLRAYPGEAYLERLLERTQEKRNLVQSIVARARLYEQQAQLAEALAQWEVLKTIYDAYPGLAAEIERVSGKRDAAVENVSAPSFEWPAAAPSAEFSAAPPVMKETAGAESFMNASPPGSNDISIDLSPAAGPTPKPAAVSAPAAVEGPAPAPGVDSHAASTVRASRPRKWGWYVAALLASVLGVSAAVVANRPRPIPAERALGTAIVRAQQADFLDSGRSSGKRLMTLQRGTRVNVLSELLAASQPFIRVQFISAKKNSPSGYMRTAELGDWDSSDPRIAWEFVAVLRPPERASEQQRREFAEHLRAFAARFSGTQEACSALHERAVLLLGIVDEHRIAGAPHSETDEDLAKAKDALAAPGCSSDEALLKRANEVSRTEAEQALEPQPAAVSPEEVERRRQFSQLERKAYSLFNEGEFERLCEVADQMEPLDHKAAGRWKAECNNLLDLAHPKKQ